MVSITACDDGDQGRLVAAEEPRVAHGASQNAAQHVATSVVGGKHAIGKEERDRTRMVGEYPV